MPTEQSPLRQRVREELLRLRKLSTGVTVEAIALSPTICALLGAGDPYIAYTTLQHRFLDLEPTKELSALAASLGLTADGDTHLKRLDAYGLEAYLDQRQVRRYSDKGVNIAADLITTNWPTQTVPQLTVSVDYDNRTLPPVWGIHLMTKHLHVVEMKPLRPIIRLGETTSEPDLVLITREDQRWQYSATADPLFLSDEQQETSLSLSWRGELWPKFNVEWITPSPLMVTESLGNKLMLRLRNSNQDDSSD